MIQYRRSETGYMCISQRSKQIICSFWLKGEDSVLDDKDVIQHTSDSELFESFCLWKEQIATNKY